MKLKFTNSSATIKDEIKVERVSRSFSADAKKYQVVLNFNNDALSLEQARAAFESKDGVSIQIIAEVGVTNYENLTLNYCSEDIFETSKEISVILDEISTTSVPAADAESETAASETTAE